MAIAHLPPAGITMVPRKDERDYVMDNSIGVTGALAAGSARWRGDGRPALALADPARPRGGGRVHSVELKANRHDRWLKNF